MGSDGGMKGCNYGPAPARPPGVTARLAIEPFTTKWSPHTHAGLAP